jgi:polyisoprenoid-binding protein YceI
MRILIFAAALMIAPNALAEPQSYGLGPAHTQIEFSVDRFGFTHVLGRFDTIAGEMVIDEAAPERSSVHAVIQTASYNSGDALRDAHMKGPLWLNVDQFPTMEFRSTAVHLTAPRGAQVIGDLTLNGQTHPLTLNVTLNNIGPNPAGGQHIAGFTATGIVHRSQWGITTAANLIGDEIDLTIEALAVPPNAVAPSTPAPARQ